MMKMMDKVMVAMSGGVDSSVAAAILKSRGYEVIGATMRISDHMDEAVYDAKKVADTLGIEHVVYDYREKFKQDIVDYFIASYKKGITPNPCIRCNKEIKFGLLLEDAKKAGCGFMATGHYIKVEKNEAKGKYVIRRNSDDTKDQTYFLYRLGQEQLSHLLTPLAGSKKEQVRKVAEELGLHVSAKSDSQDICFIEDKDYKRFIAENSAQGSKEGDFIDINGNVIGRHKGVASYTVGQRKGLGGNFGRPVYVVSINAADNTIVLGSREDCFGRMIHIEDIALSYDDEIREKMSVECKVRSFAKPEKAKLYNKCGKVMAVFEVPVWAPAPGQSAVFYEGDFLYGGGTIAAVEE
jgi:tRNA-uridine 2-sulfurtransferase